MRLVISNSEAEVVHKRELGAIHATLRDLAANLLRVGERGADMRPVAEQIKEVYLRSNERRFATRGMGSWADDSDETKARKSGGSLLRDTGRLAESLTSRFGSTQLEDHEPALLRFGTEVPYARYLDSGTKHMPARKLIDLTPSEERRIADLLESYIAGGASIAGLF